MDGVFDWVAITDIVGRLSWTVVPDGRPSVVVGVLRGGMVPAILLAHALGLRDVRAIDVRHTITDSVNASKTPNPTVWNPGSLGDLNGLDVLVVDDVVGSGATIATTLDLVRDAGATRVRLAACIVNEISWFTACSHDPSEVLTYIGRRHRGWVIFPWEEPGRCQ